MSEVQNESGELTTTAGSESPGTCEMFYSNIVREAVKSQGQMEQREGDRGCGGTCICEHRLQKRDAVLSLDLHSVCQLPQRFFQLHDHQILLQLRLVDPFTSSAHPTKLSQI